MTAAPLPRLPRICPPPLPAARPHGVERRRSPRVTASIAVTYTSSHNFFCGQTRDLSEGGLFLQSNAKLESGDALQVNLRLMKHQISLACEVVWVLADDQDETVGLGVRFVALDEAARRAIEAFMMLRDPIDFLVDLSESAAL